MAAGGAAAAIAQAIKASGVIVRVEQDDFTRILNRMDNPLIVLTERTGFGRKYKYITSYKGIAFFTQSSDRLYLPSKAEVVVAKTIWIP